MPDTVYVFVWGNNERRAELKGRSCRILVRGGKGTVLVEFLDTLERVTCSFRALRRLETRRSERCSFPAFEAKSGLRFAVSPRRRHSGFPHDFPANGRVLDATERGWPSTRVCDWRMPATVRGQRSGCGAAYQSGGHSRAEAVLELRSTAGGEPHIPALNAARVTGEDTTPHKEIGYSPARHYRGGRHLLGAARPHCSFRNHLAARVCAQADDRRLALGSRVAGAGRDRPAGVRLESVFGVPGHPRLLVQRVELVRDPAGEPVPGGVAREAREDVAGAGALADPVREGEVRRPVRGARVPTRARLVLSGFVSRGPGLPLSVFLGRLPARERPVTSLHGSWCPA